ncbi:MAG: DUF4263 domain-containing protein [Acidobacteriota bacterium]|nr:DUF4263 domain-containing protein [Acidobacteriota bacterium]
MNIVFTTTGQFEDPDHKLLIKTLRDQKQIVETMPIERLMGYLKFDAVSQRAAVDALLCKADTDPDGVATYTLPRALKLAADFRQLPESCAMRDGRKWKSIPFIVISEQPYFFGYPDEIRRLNVTLIHSTPYPQQILSKVKETVDDYLKRILEDYRQLGIMFTFEKGRARIGPALKKKAPEMESAYYYAPADRRNNRGWVAVMRDQEAISTDVEIFQRLIDMKVSERQMQCFFEENPFFLSQLRLGVQVPHPSYRTHRWSPDFAFTSILGASDIEDIDLLELKGPAEDLLNNHKHHPGFTSILQSAINQVRDYGEYISHPENYRKIMRQFGYIPTTSKLAVVLGRDSDDKEKMEILDKRRQYVPDVEIITYDKILETQAHQLSPIIAPTMLEVASLRLGGAVTNFLY